MCNAYNHFYDCPCGFGPGNGGGGRPGRSFVFTRYEPISGGWAKDNGGTVASYVNANAHCPVCGEAVYFYRSPYDGRVFFDDLGWLWPKHGCTDNSRDPRRATRDSVVNLIPKPVPQWRSEGWEPLLSAWVVRKRSGLFITGDFRDQFVELKIITEESIDHDSPIFVREHREKPGFFEVNFLRSDPLVTRDRIAPAQCITRISYVIAKRKFDDTSSIVH
jgi:hypothetical protein